MFCCLASIISILLVVGIIFLARCRQKTQGLDPYNKLPLEIGSVAHDARGLLRAARTSVERLSIEPELSSSMRQLIELTNQQIQSAENFLRVLGLPPDEPQDVDAVAMLRLVVSMHSRKKNIEKAALEGKLSVFCPPRSLSRLLSSLIDQALRQGNEARVRLLDGQQLAIEYPLSGQAPSEDAQLVNRQTAQAWGAALSQQNFTEQNSPWTRFVLDFAQRV